MPFQHRGHRGYTEDTEDLYPDLSRAIIGCGMRVHSALGPGLLESVYEECLCHELQEAGLEFRRQVDVPLRYASSSFAVGFRMDLLVNDTAIVEVKAVEQLLVLHEAQLLTYLRMTGKRLGLLLNFNVRHFREGIRRRVL